ncbi:MAG: pentapeptide repeat-containing protein [Bacteroidia bacterium]
MEENEKRIVIKNLRKKSDAGDKIIEATFSMKYVLDYIEVSNEKIKKNDFIDCDFNAAQFKSVEFCDCTFQKIVFSDARFIGTNILKSYFEKCIFNDTAFILKENKITEIISSTFANCSFSNLVLDYTLFKNCKFINCKIKNTDFNGSRFEDVVFKGKISDSFFRAKIKHLPIYSLFAKLSGKVINSDLLLNKMANVDFVDCELDGNSFCDGIDLSNCKFPNSERYLFVKDVTRTYTDAFNYINDNWIGEDLRLAKIVFENILMSKYKGENQINDFIDFDIITANINGNFSRKFKEVLERPNSLM